MTYDLAMHLTETEPVTLEPPLKVAWTYEFSSPFSAPPLPVSLIAENVVYLENDISIKAIDADTGELLWNKGWGANLAYKDGVLTPFHQPFTKDHHISFQSIKREAITMLKVVILAMCFKGDITFVISELKAKASLREFTCF